MNEKQIDEHMKRQVLETIGASLVLEVASEHREEYPPYDHWAIQAYQRRDYAALGRIMADWFDRYLEDRVALAPEVISEGGHHGEEKTGAAV